MPHSQRAQQVADAVGRGMFERDTCSRSMGMTLDGIRPGYARMSMAIREDMANGHGIAHGGVIFTLADATFAYACNSYNHVTVATNCDITFSAAGRIADRLTAVAEERHVHGRNGIYDVTVTNQNGEVIAIFRGHSRRLQGQVVPELELDHA